ncbi:tRNA epoxyqueuosine(34) reductase QueG [Devosia sp. 63-57]|uniref:tRNA epoxyqueuosine(34) reductase QueG n=1 Tax=Devosia sp. 63-57 TaxID=1895751 RepID=UPI00086E2950|nr:tRNA epoxyqueuosine(34) reductase QueG [Devosia sp. 63-57]ODT48847.1 MAG: tRNA epoxyqueuosine(34) reductase QueG [Pelagibacterium sp. SCN 63-126]ODU86865.1 MAG: tRNA epoxyqueuosine(34) reductase QueG [Pelagibacterium sp. SCN 63-17]OJX44225.1 MAG: tRNA epoxyqueuosine(34) reductase QueG [Devosia sp. 63-57]
MRVPLLDPQKLIAEVRARAEALGFDAFGIARADARPDLPEKLAHALAEGWHADMEWMAETEERRGDPRRLWAEARSVILLGVNYGPETDPMALLAEKNIGIISAYARNRDYHDIIKGRLKELAGLMARRLGSDVKVFVDTAPLMEKPLAEAAGLGWQGKHSVLVSRQFGSWLFLGAILTDAELPPDTPGAESCGSCTRCLDICPTDAFPAPFRLDARKCLAYYSVEHKGPIPREFRVAMGNRVYGCDDCLAVCPWNKFASVSREAKLRSRAEFERPALADLVLLDDAGFRELFSGSPVKRIGHARFLRNVLICLGNSDNAAHLPAILTRMDDASPLVRGAAIWALRRLDPQGADAVRQERLAQESDADVREEWNGAV